MLALKTSRIALVAILTASCQLAQAMVAPSAEYRRIASIATDAFMSAHTANATSFAVGTAVSVCGYKTLTTELDKRNTALARDALAAVLTDEDAASGHAMLAWGMVSGMLKGYMLGRFLGLDGQVRSWGVEEKAAFCGVAAASAEEILAGKANDH